MFAEEQSDVQEFFLFLVEELSKEIESLASNDFPPTNSADEEWEEIGSHGKKLHIQESVIQSSILNQFFEIQLRKQVGLIICGK